jgi:hypothetical protein
VDEDRKEIMNGNGLGLLQFCDRVGERGDINASTAKALRSTAKKILAVVSADLAAIELRGLDVDDLLKRWVNLNKADYGEGSIETYRSRFRLVVAMYLAWLADDPQWKVAGRAAPKRSTTRSGNDSLTATTRRQGRPKPAERITDDLDDSSRSSVSDIAADSRPAHRMMTYDVPLRSDVVVRVTLPFDLTTEDAQRLKNFVDALAFSGSTQPESRTEGGLE